MSLTSNLVSYWKFDESSGNASDSTSNNKTLTNTGTTTFAAAKINNGADFGTTNSSKYFSRTGYVISDGAQSLSFWVKQRTEIASGTQTFVFSGSESTTFRVYYDYNSGTRRLVLLRERNNKANETTTYTVTLGTSNFYHIVGTYDGTNLLLYVNGTNVASGTSSSNGTTNWSPGGGYFSVGAARDPNDGTVAQYASAYIDEVAAYNRAITSSEVTSLYAAGVGLQYPFPNSYTMTAEAGTYTFTGKSANLFRTNMTNMPKPTSSMTNIPKP